MGFILIAIDPNADRSAVVPKDGAFIAVGPLRSLVRCMESSALLHRHKSELVEEAAILYLPDLVSIHLADVSLAADQPGNLHGVTPCVVVKEKYLAPLCVSHHPITSASMASFSAFSWSISCWQHVLMNPFLLAICLVFWASISLPLPYHRSFSCVYIYSFLSTRTSSPRRQAVDTRHTRQADIHRLCNTICTLQQDVRSSHNRILFSAFSA